MLLTSAPLVYHSTPATAERIGAIDAIRALAVIGVVVAHVTGSVMAYRADAVMARAGPLDYLAGAIDLTLIVDKARACFAFLFGAGFALFAARAAAHGQALPPRWGRRMAGLLLFGLLNQALLFFGDILILYAVAGSTLLLVRRWPDRVILAVALVAVAVPPLVDAAAVAAGEGRWSLIEGAGYRVWRAGAAAAYEGDSYAPIVAHNLRFLHARWGIDTGRTALWAAGVVGMILLGLWWMRRGLFAPTGRDRAMLERLARVGVPVGGALSLFSMFELMGVALPRPLAVLSAAAAIGAPLMAVGLVALCTLRFGDRPGPVQRLLAPLGRLSLTAYLANAAVAGPLLYGYGLGWAGAIGLAELNVLAVAIAALMLACARWWLHRFRHGPCEWLWRSLAGDRWQPMRIA